MAYVQTEWKNGDLITAEKLNNIERGIGGSQEKLSGTPGQLIGIGDGGTAQATLYPSALNLLINHYFPRPVNRNGQTNYTENRYTIDGWRLSTNSAIRKAELVDDGIELTSDETGSAYFNFSQLRDDIGPGTYTLSFLVDNTDNVSQVFAGDTARTYFSKRTGDGHLITGTFTVPTDALPSLSIGIQKKISAAPLIVIAAKLELGSVQTLAHKEGDKWVLNEIPNYAEQYAVCSQYSPRTGEFVGSQHSNQNLLDNWYFVDPINQRGETEWPNILSKTWLADRWFISGSYPISATLTDNGITIKNEGTGTSYFVQDIDNNIIRGKMITLSIIADHELYSVTITSPASGAGNANAAIKNLGALRLYVQSNGIAQFTVDIYSGKEMTITAAKLELGPVQTLAHKEGDEWVLNDPPPNKALELEKCQRYQLVLKLGFLARAVSYAAGTIDFVLPVPTIFRARPTIVNTENIKITTLTGYSQPDFSFSVVGTDLNSVHIRGTKESHGLTDATLMITGNVILDANL